MNKSQAQSIIYGIGVNSFNRFQAFLEILPMLKGKAYWQTLRNAYQSSDNLYGFRGLVRAAFSRPEPHRESLMTKKERNRLHELPERFTIYRAMTREEFRSGKFGVSWTLNREIAEFFATQYQRNIATKHKENIIHKLEISKANAVALFEDRNEFEIIYLNRN